MNMGKNMHGRLQEEKDVAPVPSKSRAAALGRLSSLVFGNLFAILFFVAVWGLLAFRESAQLFRINELSVFLYDDLFYEEMMSMPAGILYYVASWLVQFFYYPALGATIYVALLALVYRLTYKVFDIPKRFRLLAMLPVVALLATNTQLGYWIFYIKIPGYYYVALLGVLLSLLAMWAVKKLHVYLKPFAIAAWIYLLYPCLGVYALVSGVVMAVYTLCSAIASKDGAVKVAISSVTMLAAVATAYFVPPHYYKRYTTVPVEEVYAVGVPVSQWKSEHVPNNEDKDREVSIIKGVNGRVGYPVDKVLTKFRLNVDGSFSQKAFATSRNDLFASSDINRPVDGKEYTLTFVGKDGGEYYVDNAGGNVAFVSKEKGSDIPKTGHFTCVADKKIKDIISFRTSDGKYLVWNKEDDERYSVRLASSSENSHCAVVKMKKEPAVRVTDDSELFGIVNLVILGKGIGVNEEFRPQFVPNLADGVLGGSSVAVFNDACTSALRIEEVGFEPAPFPLEMQYRSMWYNVKTYWIPFFVLLVSFVLLALLPVVSHCCCVSSSGIWHLVMWIAAALLLLSFTCLFWYGNENYRVENAQNRAMWDEEWETVADLAREPEIPTRQVVMNRNIALLKLGRLGNDMFSYPDGSADIEASIPVRLAQTGGKMAYYQYGKFNFCYRWCVEDAVEYGWRIEYLKHAVRSMMLAGEHRLAQRYIDILKRTLFYSDWAYEMERFVQNPETVTRNREFAMPLSMTCYDDFLDVDESYVEAYLTKNMTNASEKMSRVYVEAAIASALTRKDSKAFWAFLNYYVNELKANALPKHYQEAVLLFLNVDKGRTVQVPKAFLDKFISVGTNTKLNKFMQLVSQHKGKTEAEMAPYFEKDFKDTYFYFYFFVRNIKTN